MTVVDIRNLPEKPLGLLMPLAGTEYIPSEEDLEWAKKEMS